MRWIIRKKTKIPLGFAIEVEFSNGQVLTVNFPDSFTEDDIANALDHLYGQLTA